MFITLRKNLHKIRWYWNFLFKILNCFVVFTKIVILFLNCLFQQQVQNFGEPFFLVIHEGETLAEVKVRIQKKLQVPDEEFSKVSFFMAHHLILFTLLNYVFCHSHSILLITCNIYMFVPILKLIFVSTNRLHSAVYMCPNSLTLAFVNIIWLISGSLLSCHWVVRSTCRILTSYLIVFRFVFFN